MIKFRGIASLLVSLELTLKSHRTWLAHSPGPLFEIDKQFIQPSATIDMSLHLILSDLLSRSE
jgi:hypothetical protein